MIDRHFAAAAILVIVAACQVAIAWRLNGSPDLAVIRWFVRLGAPLSIVAAACLEGGLSPLLVVLALQAGEAARRTVEPHAHDLNLDAAEGSP